MLGKSAHTFKKKDWAKSGKNSVGYIKLFYSFI